MSKKKIENPKVFISYAWGTKDYQDRVLSFATDLMSDGIDVILDKWNLSEGNDTYAFMEQSVNDNTVTNVLLLLDPTYAKKANDREGGVGTETQIISSEIYNNVQQDKFLPVVFKRDEDDGIPKPTYLKSILHFDLSLEEKYDEEYQRLVKTLYGVEIHRKPELGKKPLWLEKTSSSVISTKVRAKYDILRTNISDSNQQIKLQEYMEEIKNKVLGYSVENEGDISYEEYIEAYAKTKDIRDDFLYLVKNAVTISENDKIIVSKLEEICDELEIKTSHSASICKILLHEMFIYLIAIYYNSKKYNELAYIFKKSYFVGNAYNNIVRSFSVFRNYDDFFDRAVCNRDDKKYLSGTAEYWIENINTQICSKYELVFADVLCYNASIYIQSYNDMWKWFPITYPYGGYNNMVFNKFAKKLCSKEHLLDITRIFGYDTVDILIDKMEEIENGFRDRKFENYRFDNAFNTAPLLCHYINVNELGKYN